VDKIILDWNVAEQKLKADDESGDLYVVKPFPEGVLAAVIDGLGHGAEAAAASRTAAAILEAFAHESVISLMERCHQALKGTRGAAMSLASFNTLDRAMTWLGVGNVEGVLLYINSAAKKTHKSLLLRAGIVGCNLPQLYVSVVPLTRGDTLILATDGISYDFAREQSVHDSPRLIAGRILARYGKGKDDALVLVARYLGGMQ
jgi:serine/threonine protein phosphatase PrpC